MDYNLYRLNVSRCFICDVANLYVAASELGCMLSLPGEGGGGGGRGAPGGISVREVEKESRIPKMAGIGRFQFC